ncbi:TPR repeat-containing protein [Rippkaea orientalis PCC 8801]|uniref:TPR repeat-containing protein n=1 Tax=Rippkaea orientalis (strain PCC 8801 / RF-1) TaxID=41431 RepID=B7K2E6_RIPO1|nr:tetratricopeptide repeat protein [Rippkaea orientalis]ACK65282.1 TPR repeat-containing protein [Rippkaea orientalis PCC 8801]
MNPLSTASITQNNEETYASLLVSIEAGIGMLQIFIAVCDADIQREQLIAKYTRELAPNIQTYRVTLNPQEPSLRLAILQQVSLGENIVAMVTGTETLGLGKNDDSLDKFFGYLQWTREGLRELKMPIVLWLSFRIFRQLAKKAPDFYSWRNGIFQFESEPSLVTNKQPFIEEIESIEDQELSSIFDVEQLESSLEKAINQWGENSSKVETLYSQLGALYANHVQSGKATDRDNELILAEEYLKKAIALQTQFKRENSLPVSLTNLAGLYSFQGRYKEAEPLYQQVLSMTQKLLGIEHPDVATSLNNLAGLYESQGRYEAAEPLYQQALSLYQKLLGSEHPSVATSLNNLAYLYQSQGRYKEAEPLYQQALSLYQKLLGSEHPDVATSLNNLARLYYFQGRYEEAEPLYQQALSMTQKLLGSEHPSVASSLNNLAGLYESQGRYKEAEPLYQQALSIKQKLLGSEHPSVATSLNNLAYLYESQGRYEAAEPLYQQALSMTQKLLGSEHPSVATSLNNLAGLYYFQGRYEAAEPLYQQALSIAERTLGENHPNTNTIRNNYTKLRQQNAQ